MDYREILKYQLRKRQEMNPKYSLRAFAKKLSLSPSKVSEILSGKKRLSADRAEEISHKLSLNALEKEFFVLSAKMESSSKKIDRNELAQQMRDLSSQIQAKKTLQRNAWYFGAVKALEEAGYDSSAFQQMLALTSLQVENAKRFIKRIAKIYPDRKQMSFEPISLLRKVEDCLYSDGDRCVEADFLFLSESDQEELERKIKSLIKTYKVKTKQTDPENLKMIYWGCLKLNNN